MAGENMCGITTTRGIARAIARQRGAPTFPFAGDSGPAAPHSSADDWKHQH